MRDEPKHVSLGVFKPGTADKPRQSLAKGVLFVLIALTDLDKGKDLFRPLAGSHGKPRDTPQEDWDIKQITLSPGDAFLWRPELALMPSDKGGGKFLKIDLEVVGV